MCMDEEEEEEGKRRDEKLFILHNMEIHNLLFILLLKRKEKIRLLFCESENVLLRYSF
jgi:hypothetical protein